MFDKLTKLEAGLELANVLESVDRDRLSGEELVGLMRARHRQISHLQAEFYADVLAVADAVALADPELGVEYAGDEIAAALTWTRRRAEAELDFASELAVFLQVAGALGEGRVDVAKAKVIVFGLTGIDHPLATTIAAQVMERAERQTTGQIRARLRRLLLETDPKTAEERYEAGLRERKVVFDGNDDGTANLHFYNVAPDQAGLAHNRIEQYAQALATTVEPRTLDQLRADVGLDLLVGCLEHAERGKKPIVDIRVDLATLLELDQKPGEIPGWGPVIADIARQLADQRHAEWRYYIVDDHEIVGNGTTRRRPSRPQRRRIETRYPHCIFPGCRTPSIHTDLDHRTRWADGGPTDDNNLNPVCEHHHPAKDQGGWRLEMLDPHTFEWTSPLGIKHLVEIEPP